MWGNKVKQIIYYDDSLNYMSKSSTILLSRIDPVSTGGQKTNS